MTSRYAQLFRRAAGARHLISATLELTHRCHLDCMHCYLEDNHAWESRARELDTAEVCSVIDQLREAGCFFLALTGGEVFLRDDVLTVMAHARRHGMAVKLFTTGTLLTEARISALAQLHPMRVELSVYSADALVHDSITGRPGSHQKTMTAMARLHALRVPLRMKCPLMRSNFDSLRGLRELSAELGIGLLVDVTVTARNDGGRDPLEGRLTHEQLVAFTSDRELSRYAMVDRRPAEPGEPMCNVGTSSVVIGPFGDVYACMELKTPVGNVRASRVADIWQGPALTRLRAHTVEDLPVCRTCEKHSYCNRCAGMAENEHGDRFGPSQWACTVARAKDAAADLSPAASAAERQAARPDARPRVRLPVCAS